MASSIIYHKKIDIENRTCYYFDYTMEIIDINFRYILLDEKKDENILIYNGGITDSINYYFAKIRIGSYNSLPIEKILIFHNTH